MQLRCTRLYLNFVLKYKDLKYLLFIAMILLPNFCSAQTITGKVRGSEGELLIGATVEWLGTNIGVSTDRTGAFSISKENINTDQLIVGFVGMKPDTLSIGNETYVEVQLIEPLTLEELEVAAKRPDSYVSKLDPIKTEVITQGELAKAACCDLAGCFGTEGTVEATTTNIVTNSKELRILGLSGVYNQVLIDGFPLIQGATYTYGISTVPGALVDNIYVAKGTNSVLQGYEGMVGQINVILKNPVESERLFLNVYLNSFLESQFNGNFSHQWNKWSTIVGLHTTQPARKMDRDKDTFLDMPKLTRYSLYNKWQYGNSLENGWHSMIGMRLINEKRVGGQMDFNPNTHKGGTQFYGQTVNFFQPEFYTKSGYRFNNKQNLILMASSLYHDQNSWFGTTQYNAEQVNFYSKIQFEHDWQQNNSLKIGLTYRVNELKETIDFGENPLNRSYDGRYVKKESIPGIFAENSFSFLGDKLTFLAGITVDHHNNFGVFFSPRTMFRYAIAENTTLRFSAGTGWRTINLFSENVNLLASSRDVIIADDLKPEEALNIGANIVHKLFGNNFNATLSLDAYRTIFSNQIFPDYNIEATKAYIANFEETSIGNGIKAEISVNAFEQFNAKISYNYLDVYRMVDDYKYVLPFNAKHKVGASFSYQPISDKWRVDMNMHWYGKQQLPDTRSNPTEFQLPSESDPYSLVGIQFTKKWKAFELYTGCENIFDFRQKRAILSWENPFSPYFDTAAVWGPTKGREFYMGLRYRLAK